MGMLEEKDAEKVRQLLAALTHPVKLVTFTQEFACQYCHATRELLEEVAGLSDHLTLEVYDFVADREQVDKFGIERIPATVVMDERDYGIRFYGVPGGYEFTSLLEDILDIGRGGPRIPEPLLAELAKIDRPVKIQVMVTPTCPYCPRAVRAAHRFAMASEHVTGVMIDIPEFPEVGNRYNVQTVPHTVVNEVHDIVGAMPEMQIAKRILQTLAS